MTPTAIRKKFADFLGRDSYNVFLEEFQLEGRRDRQLRSWHVSSWNRFATLHNLDIPASWTALAPLFQWEPRLAPPSPPLTKEAFLSNPVQLYFTRRRPIPRAWLHEAWQQLPAFRDNVSWEIASTVSKTGGFGLAKSLVATLAAILTSEEWSALFEYIVRESGRSPREWQQAFDAARRTATKPRSAVTP